MFALALHALICAIAIPIVPYQGVRAVVDTGGMTESRAQRPLDFETVYRGLGVDYAIGVDYLSLHDVRAGDTAGKPKHTVKLDVRSSPTFTSAFVNCTIGRRTYRMLLDTVAVAWPSQTTSKPVAALYLSSAAFEALHRARPELPYRAGGRWIVDSHGAFVEAPSLVATTSCGGVTRYHRLVVEREDNATYALLHQLYGIKVDGDVSLSAWPARGVDINFPGRALDIY